MRRAFLALFVVLAIAVPGSARASVDQASFSAQIYPASVGSVVTVTATLYGFNGQGDAGPKMIVPNELSAQSSSSCYAQTGTASSPQAEVTPCYLSQSPHIGGEAMAVRVELPELGLYQRYGVVVTLMLLVTDTATPGEIYQVQIPGSLAGGSLLPPGVYAGIQVLPRGNMSGGSEAVSQTSGSTSAATAWLSMSPRAIRLAPKGQTSVLVQPLVNTQGQMPQLSVTITIPSSLKLIGDPSCMPVSASLTGGSPCSGPATIAPDGATVIVVSPGSSERGVNGIVLTVSPSDNQAGYFAQIGANLNSGDGAVSITTKGIAFTNVDFASDESIVSASQPGSRVVLLELTHDFTVNGSSCWASQVTQTPELTLQLWGDGNSVVGLSRHEGFVGESTGDGQNQSCYVPYVSPVLPDESLYVVKVGTCFRCGIGLVVMSSGADQVIPDYELAPSKGP